MRVCAVQMVVQMLGAVGSHAAGQQDSEWGWLCPSRWGCGLTWAPKFPTGGLSLGRQRLRKFGSLSKPTQGSEAQRGLKPGQPDLDLLALHQLPTVDFQTALPTVSLGGSTQSLHIFPDPLPPHGPSHPKAEGARDYYFSLKCELPVPVCAGRRAWRWGYCSHL